MKSINLLPKNRQSDLRYEMVYRSMRTVIWVSLFSFGVVALAQVGIRLYLENQLRSIDSQIAALQKSMSTQDDTEIKNKIKTINDAIADYKTLAEASPKWSKVFKAFVALPPEGVRVDSLVIEPAKKAATVRGLSPTREAVLEFYDNIQKDSNFSNPINPFENIVRAKNVDFQLMFNIKEDLLK